MKRRILSLAAVCSVSAIVAVPAALAQASPVQAGAGQAGADRAGPGRVAVTISSMNPQYAEPGRTVTMTGTVTNGTGQTAAGLDVQLAISSTPFSTRDGMDSYLANGINSGLLPAGRPYLLPASVAPGASVRWSASFQISAQPISAFGVYPVAVLVQDAVGTTLASEPTLLPFWPGQRAAALQAPLNISWLWPLIDQPHHQVCTALTNNDLAASLGPGGRLSTLLTAGMSHAGAGLTWVVDPALLSDVATMTKPYPVGGSSSSCEGARPQPASQAAVSWLSSVKTATSGQPTLITPYADVDMTALIHQGLNADLATAYRTGDAVAGSILGRVFKPATAWPPGGTADLSVLTSLAVTEHIATVVLNSSEMPPSGTGFHPDDAVASIPTAAGTTMSVLLADDTLTSVLRAGNTSSGALSPSTEFAVKQRFLAETAMIAAESPDSTRSVVVAPPAGWSPSVQLAGDLLDETTGTPWLKPATLHSLTTTPDTERKVARQPPPASQASPDELSRSYLSRVSPIGTQLSVYKSILVAPSSYLRSLDEALAATESAAWRGGGEPQGVALRSRLHGYLTSAESKVKIITSAEVPMAGASGPVPVSIQNGLRETVEVRLNVIVVKTPRATSPLIIGPFKEPVIIPPGEASAPVRLPVRAAPQGASVLQLSLSSPDGTPLTFAPPVQLTVQSTRYGRAILFLIGAAIGVFVLTSIYRGVRRRLRDDSHVVNEEGGAPGSVVTGTSARHPTEAPDDLADARRWADDA